MGCKGIVVSASAGNSGPGESTVVNVAPLFLTVGASTINREFPANIVLSNGETFTGTSLYAVHGSDEAQGKQARTSSHILPTSAITFAAAEKIKKYLSTEASHVVTTVFHGTVVGRSPSTPRMASFPSRGPSWLVLEILKPDVTAPGMDILAAWTGAASPSLLDGDTRHVQYNIMSGTSISCPQDYIAFLRALGYTAEQMAVFSSATNCSTRVGAGVGDLKYPAFSAVFGSEKRAVTQRRVMRNVGSNARLTYRAKIASPAGAVVMARPQKLQFSATQGTQEYAITFTP
uniref:Subtilisin-like protease n=1 Tax=Aegilops tauschii TaxID=37682 RepID=M8ANX2_AEGTA